MPAVGTAIRAGAAYVELFAKDNRLVRGLHLAEARLKAFGQKVSQLGKRMLLFSGAAAAPIAFATKTFGRFEDQMKAVQAVTGATGDEFQRLYDQAKELGRTTSYTAAEVGAGQLNLARAGFDPAEIEAAIPGILNLARATGTDLAQAADIAGGTLRAFTLDATEMGRVTDVLVATANNSAQTLEDLGESMKYAAPIAEEYGLSLEQTAKAVGVLANMQIKGTMAGTSLRQIMLSLADPAVQQSLHAVGVEALDASKNLRPVGDIMIDLGKAMAGMTNAKRLALGKSLFDQRAAGAALKLAKSDFPALSAAIDNAGGTAERTAKVMDSGLGGAFRRMMSAVEGIQIAVGEALAGALGGVMDRVAGLSVSIAKLISANKEWVIGIGLTVAAIAAAGAGLVTLGLAGQMAAFVFGGIATIFSTVGAALGLVLAAIGALLTPVGAVSAAVIGLAGYLVYASGTGQKAITWLGEKFAELRDTASKAFQGIGDALAAGDLALAGKILWTTLKVEWQKGVNALNEVWVGFKQTFLNAWTDAVYGLASIFTRGVAMLEEVWTTFSGAVVDRWKTVEQALAEGIGLVIAKAQGLDPEEVLGNVRQDYARQRKAREQATGARLQEIATNREQELGVLEEGRKRDRAEREARYGAALSDAANELADLVRQRDEAIAAARAARETGGATAGGPEAAGRLQEAMAGMGVAETVAAKATAGTFSAQAAELLGGGETKTLQDIHKETVEQKRLQEKIERNTRRLQLAWAD
jgi:TP901 family phage tail tape measure protein